MLKLNNLTPDGVVNAEPLDVTLRDNESGAPTGCVFVVRPGSNKEWERIQESHVDFKRNPHTKAMERTTDVDAALNTLITRKLVTWSGLQAVDGTELQYTPALVPAVLDALVNGYKFQLLRGIIGNEHVTPAEVQDASFRAAS